MRPKIERFFDGSALLHGRDGDWLSTHASSVGGVAEWPATPFHLDESDMAASALCWDETDLRIDHVRSFVARGFEMHVAPDGTHKFYVAFPLSQGLQELSMGGSQ